MRNRQAIWQLLLIGLLGILPNSSIFAQDAGAYVIKRGHITEDIYIAGGQVHVLAEVEGDVVAAGGRVVIDQQVTGDVLAAGGSVELRGIVQDTVRAAAGTLTLNGQIGSDAVVAGGNVSLGPEASVAGRAWLAGGNVDVAGRVGRELRVRAGTVSIAGEIDGDAELAAREIIILPSARIEGNLTYRSAREANIDPDAEIAGEVIHIPVEPAEKPGPVQRTVFAVLPFLSLLLAGVVLVVLLPHFTIAAARTIESDPWKSLGLGLALLVATPVAMGLMMATVIGIPVGLAGLALYFISLLAGFLMAVVFLGDVGIRLLYGAVEVSRGWRIVSVIAALFVLAVIRLIPVVGTMALLLALLFGLGAWALRAYRLYITAL